MDKVSARCPDCGKLLTVSRSPRFAFHCDSCNENLLFVEGVFDSNECKDESLLTLWGLVESIPYDRQTRRYVFDILGIGDGTEPPTVDDVWRWFDAKFKSDIAEWRAFRHI